MKTYILMLSKYFPATHKRAGVPTFFPDMVSAAVSHNLDYWQKLHTIRANYLLWEKRIKEVREGKAVLSIRHWVGMPYRSKTQVIVNLTASDSVGIQILEFEKDRDGMVSLKYFTVDGKIVDLVTLALNDGLTVGDWKEWFKDYDLSKPLAVIHFTNFRY